MAMEPVWRDPAVADELHYDDPIPAMYPICSINYWLTPDGHFHAACTTHDWFYQSGAGIDETATPHSTMEHVIESYQNAFGPIPTLTGAYYDSADEVWVRFANGNWRTPSGGVHKGDNEDDMHKLRQHLPFRRLEPIE